MPNLHVQTPPEKPKKKTPGRATRTRAPGVYPLPPLPHAPGKGQAFGSPEVLTPGNLPLFLNSLTSLTQKKLLGQKKHGFPISWAVTC